MAGNFYGGDIAQLRQLAKELASGATRLSLLGQQLSSVIGTGAWKGRDGERFRSDWTSSLLVLLKSATAGLESASKSVLANADEQEKASDGAGSGGGSGSGGSGSGNGVAQDLAERLNGMTPKNARTTSAARNSGSGRWKAPRPQRPPWMRPPIRG
ncbi:conserved hypothetical protein [Arthrobacter sp. Hiyo4]|nr:conserved hypothetical protein [Arthrobacter sp. Hiyo4]